MTDDGDSAGRSPGWYPDDAGGQRWWDGLEWGEHVPAVAGASRGRRRLVALVGGGVLVAAVAATVVLVVGRDDDADGAPEPGSPAAVTLEYLDAESRSDQSVICSLSTEAEATELRYLYTLGVEPAEDCTGLLDPPVSMRAYGADVDSTVGDVTEDGDAATVEYVQSVSYSGSDEGFVDVLDQLYGTDRTTTGRVTLVREAGHWKVEDRTLDTEVDE